MTWQLGLGDTESQCYRLLVENGPMAPSEVATRSGSTDREATQLLGEMARKGLVTLAGAGRFQAIPPRVALGPYLARGEETLDRARTVVEELSRRYSSEATELHDVFEVAQGPESVADWTETLMRRATHSLWTFALPIDIEQSPVGGYPALDDGYDRIADHRTILDRSVLERPRVFDEMRVARGTGMQVRIAPLVPTRMMLIDGEIAMVPLVSNEDSANNAIVVRCKPIIEMFKVMFETMWLHGTPIVESQGEVFTSNELDAEDVRVISLLLTGITDRAIAKQMGLSLRTVQRRVSSLMDTCGASTRLQLGYEAGKRGWLPSSRTIRPTDRQERIGAS